MTAPETAPERPLRRDAERNRQRILQAARVVFAERGLSGSHDDIAREAGVGVGTVYRRFPDKELLIDALFEERIEEMLAVARAAAGQPDPWESLATLLVRFQELQSQDRGLKEIVLGSARGAERVSAAQSRIIPLVAKVLQRAKEAGAVRDDVEITDLPLMQMAVSTIAEASRDVAPEAWRRTMSILLDGLRAENATGRLEPPALDRAELAGVMETLGRLRGRR